MDDPANPNTASQPQNPGLTPADPQGQVPGSNNDFNQQQTTNPFPTNDPTAQANNSLNNPTSSMTTSFQMAPPPTLDPSPTSPDLNASNFNTPPAMNTDQSNTASLNFNNPPIDNTTPDQSTITPQPMPTFSPEQPIETTSQPQEVTTANQAPVTGTIDTTESATSNETIEPAPTDLSQLTGNNTSQQSSDVYSPSVAAPESLVVPTNPATQQSQATVSTTSGGGKHTLPLIAIIGALIVVLAVGGASAYFILGIGKPGGQSPTSLPIVQPSQAPLTKPPTEVPTPTAVSQPPEASGSGSDSGSFGSLDGNTGNPTPTPSSGPKTAADLLKAKQASTKPSATPKASATPASTP